MVFVMDLPVSKGYIVILVVIDRFSKGYQLIPFCYLPSALQGAEALFQHVFHYCGLPEDILSDGPQFVSWLWRAFFKKLGITDNLTTGYHPQLNGQAECAIQEISRFI